MKQVGRYPRGHLDVFSFWYFFGAAGSARMGGDVGTSLLLWVVVGAQRAQGRGAPRHAPSNSVFICLGCPTYVCCVGLCVDSSELSASGTGARAKPMDALPWQRWALCREGKKEVLSEVYFWCLISGSC